MYIIIYKEGPRSSWKAMEKCFSTPAAADAFIEENKLNYYEIKRRYVDPVD